MREAGAIFTYAGLCGLLLLVACGGHVAPKEVTEAGGEEAPESHGASETVVGAHPPGATEPSSPTCDPYSCDCGLGQVDLGGGNGPTTCVGVRFCNNDAECPPSIDHSVEPVCVSNGDNVMNDSFGHCVLPCGVTSRCPGGMQCIQGSCVFVTFDPNHACSIDEECDVGGGYRCARETCGAEGRCRTNDVPCNLAEPVCGCDGQTYPNTCALFPVALAHSGACP